MIRNLTLTQRVALAAFFVAVFLTLAQAARADVLACWPAHTPYRADAVTMDPWLFGLICTLVAIFFI